MGATDEQATMAAGFAGGIGLCGGACGALGAAVWMIALERSRENQGKVDLEDPRTQEIIDRFIEATDYEFECSKIVGREFGSVDEHAAFLRGGGCQKLIDVLTSGQP